MGSLHKAFAKKALLDNEGVSSCFIGSLAVGGLESLLNLGDDIVELGELLALLAGLAEANAHLLGGVVAHGVHDVAKEEEVKLALAIPVVDVTDLLNSISVNHFVCCGGASLAAVDSEPESPC